MIILDTNVVSETQRREPDAKVMAFLNDLDPTTTYITSITVAELLYGVDIMEMGSRKTQLENAVFDLIKMFDKNVLAFDQDAASHYAVRAADAKRRGKAVSFADGQIAGIARAVGDVKVATRDVSPFEAMGIDTVNPWEWDPDRSAERWILE